MCIKSMNKGKSLQFLIVSMTIIKYVRDIKKKMKLLYPPPLSERLYPIVETSFVQRGLLSFSLPGREALLPLSFFFFFFCLIFLFALYTVCSLSW